MKYDIHILNHYTRDCSELKNKIESLGRSVDVSTDRTDYMRKRNEYRYIGLCANYFGILTQEWKSDWKLIVHDDIVFFDNMFDNISQVLDYAPKSHISFYNPTNNTYRKTLKDGYNVIKHHNHLWTQCSAWHKDYVPEMLKWILNNVLEFGKECHEVKIIQYSCFMNKPRYTILPSFVQHEGYDKSLFGNPYKVGKNLRNSESYREFEAKEIDWENAFKNCKVDGSRSYVNNGLIKDYQYEA